MVSKNVGEVHSCILLAKKVTATISTLPLIFDHSLQCMETCMHPLANLVTPI